MRADQFQGLTPLTKPTNGAVLDGRRAHQWHLVPNPTDAALSPEMRNRRNELELAIEQLRDRKDTLPIADYFRDLERLLIPLAELNEQQER